MSDPRLHAALVQLAEDPEGRLNEDERWLLTQLGSMLAVLERAVPEYEDLRGRLLEEGPSEALEDAAFSLAGIVAAVLQSARRRPEVLLAAEHTAVAPSEAMAALDLLLHSLLIITDPVEMEMAATPEELAAQLDQPVLRRLREAVAPSP